MSNVADPVKRVAKITILWHLDKLIYISPWI
jgi:hypothetical protein